MYQWAQTKVRVQNNPQTALSWLHLHQVEVSGRGCPAPAEGHRAEAHSAAENCPEDDHQAQMRADGNGFQRSAPWNAYQSATVFRTPFISQEVPRTWNY